MQNVSVLLVEDNRDDEYITLWTLKKIGLTNVTIAHDGLEALELLHGNIETGTKTTCAPDVIFLDLKLPKIDGLVVLERIRMDERTKDLKVIILTSSEDPHDKEVCLKLGVSGFLSKPLKDKAILNQNIL